MITKDGKQIDPNPTAICCECGGEIPLKRAVRKGETGFYQCPKCAAHALREGKK